MTQDMQLKYEEIVGERFLKEPQREIFFSVINLYKIFVNLKKNPFMYIFIIISDFFLLQRH